MSISNFFMNLVASLKFLNLQSDDDYASFSAHVAWSIVVVIVPYYFWGLEPTYIVLSVWFLNWATWKFNDRGHLPLIESGQEMGPDLQNLVVNFGSNMTIPFCLSSIKHFTKEIFPY